LGAKTKAEGEVREKYIETINTVKEEIAKEKIKAIRMVGLKTLNDIEKNIIEEAKPLIKQ